MEKIDGIKIHRSLRIYAASLGKLISKNEKTVH